MAWLILTGCHPDREIFRVRDELATFEGPDVTFYDFLGVTPSASQDDINKAYRKKSRLLHPDKVKQQLNAERAKAKKDNKNKKTGVNVAKPATQSEVKAAVKLASDRQARLSIVANILKGSGRARYDHFMANGFPKWKGTNYYYDRYRPGLGTVMFGVFLALGGGAHYIALYMSWKRQREFVERYIKFARHAAWGDNFGIPAVDVGTGGVPVGTPAPPPAADEQQEQAMPTNRKMRRMQEREAKKGSPGEGAKRGGRRAATRASSASGTATPTAAAGAASAGPQGAKKRVVAENGKVLVVDSLGDVYLEQEDEDGNVEEFLLDPSEIPQPTIRDTALVRMPIWFYGRTAGRFLSKNQDGDDEYEEVEEEGTDFKEVASAETDSSSGAGGKRTPSTASVDDDFELLDKSVEDVSAPKATGSQPQAKSGKSNKRKSKKR
ncbi:DnaJ domain-containing protein [Diaporthe helianthi]|uniref:DnaJ domain-containing protein n=1 Tax=Diaporthe helianthi TaxID=158607 RepID=A0A2P5HFB7_DIAHE|nr:DnaJ domain-containing protein [Diaporthe helianthi]